MSSSTKYQLLLVFTESVFFFGVLLTLLFVEGLALHVLFHPSSTSACNLQRIFAANAFPKYMQS
jgi:hypothetical protein